MDFLRLDCDDANDDLLLIVTTINKLSITASIMTGNVYREFHLIVTKVL